MTTHDITLTATLLSCTCGMTRGRDGLPDDVWDAVGKAWATAHHELERMLGGGVCVAVHEACEGCGEVLCYGPEPCYGQREPGCLHDRDLCLECIPACRHCAADIREEHSR